MKLAVIGGGSTYTPELVAGLAREADRLDLGALVLHDIDPERREIVGGLARRIARLVDVEPQRVLVDQVGLNHLTWVRAVRLDGRDILPELMADHGDALADQAGQPRAVLDELGVVPSYYLRYFYFHDEIVAEQRDG